MRHILRYSVAVSFLAAILFLPVYAVDTDDEADLLRAEIRLDKEQIITDTMKELDLMTHYFPKFTEAIGAPRAAKFYQVERQLNRILRAKIASLVPLAKPL